MFKKLGSFPARANNFNWIRLIAALLVIYGHSYALSPSDGYFDVLRHFNLPGSHRFGLYVFFVISGYLITDSIQRRSLWFFVQSRLLRIVPAMLISCILTVALLAPFTNLPTADYLQRAFRFIYFNTSLAVGTSGDELGLFAHNPYPRHINGALWSISLEVACYLGILAITAWALFSSTLLRVAGYVAVVWILISHPPGDLSRSLQFTCVGYFLAGSLIFWVRDRFPISPWIAGAFALAIAVLTWLPVDFWPYVQHPAIVYWTFFLAFFRRLPAPLGDYSYGTYLYGFPAQQIVAAVTSLTPPVHFLCSAAIALLLGIFSWHVIEKRALSFKGTINLWMYLAFVVSALSYVYVSWVKDPWQIGLVSLCAAGGLARIVAPYGRDIAQRALRRR